MRAYEKNQLPYEAAAIIKVLKNNYRVLKQPVLGQFVDPSGVTECEMQMIMDNGLNLKFYTNTFEEEGEVWFCVFDRCYCPRNSAYFLIKDCPEQLRYEAIM